MPRCPTTGRLRLAATAGLRSREAGNRSAPAGDRRWPDWAVRVRPVRPRPAPPIGEGPAPCPSASLVTNATACGQMAPCSCPTSCRAWAPLAAEAHCSAVGPGRSCPGRAEARVPVTGVVALTQMMGRAPTHPPRPPATGEDHRHAPRRRARAGRGPPTQGVRASGPRTQTVTGVRRPPAGAAAGR